MSVCAAIHNGICMKMTCRARSVMHFAAQAQRFVRSSVCYAVPLGLAFGESCFWGVGCGRAIGICVSGCGIEALFSRQVSAEMPILDSGVLRCGSGSFVAGAGNCEVISWQAQYFVRVRRVDAERFVAGAGNREVVSCGRGECRCHIGIGV